MMTEEQLEICIDKMMNALDLAVKCAILAEREACAKIAESHHLNFQDILHQDLSAVELAIGKNISKTIRARGEK